MPAISLPSFVHSMYIYGAPYILSAGKQKCSEASLGYGGIYTPVITEFQNDEIEISKIWFNHHFSSTIPFALQIRKLRHIHFSKITYQKG